MNRLFHSRWLAWAIVMLVAVAVRWAQLDAQSLTMDEVKDLDTARDGWTSAQAAEDRFPPLYYVALWASHQVAPWDENGHAFSALCGVLTVAAIGGLGRAIGGPSTALWAAGLAAVAPFAVWYSVESRVYALYLLTAALALWQFTEAVQRGARLNWLFFATAAIAGIYTHYYFGVLVAIAGLFFLATRPGRSQLLTGLLAFAVIAAASIPAIGMLRSDLDQPWGYAKTSGFSVAGLAYTYLSYLTGYTLGPSLRELHVLSARDAAMAAAPAALALGAATMVLLTQAWLATPRDVRWRWAAWFAAFCLVPPALVGVVSELAGMGYNPRHVLWASMPLLVALAVGAANGRPRGMSYAAVAAVIAAFFVAQANRVWSDAHRNEDARAAAAYLTAELDQPRPVFVLSGYMDKPLAWYLPSGYPVYRLPDDDGDEEKPIETAITMIREKADAYGDVWLAYSREFHGDPDGRLLAALQREFALDSVAEFAGIRLYRSQSDAAAKATNVATKSADGSAKPGRPNSE